MVLHVKVVCFFSISSCCLWPHTKLPAGHFGSPTCCDWTDAGVVTVVGFTPRVLLGSASVLVEDVVPSTHEWTECKD